jgi:hypothetical protein
VITEPIAKNAYEKMVVGRLIFFFDRPEFLITQAVYFDEDTTRKG